MLHFSDLALDGATVFRWDTGLVLFFLLESILFSLSLSTSQTFGGQSLVTKGCPWSEVLTTLAPLDFQTCLTNDPHINITECAQALVLSRNDSKAALFLHRRCVLLIPRRRGVFLVSVAAVAAATIRLGTVTAWTSLTTHDTASHTLGKVHRLLLRHVRRIIHKRRKFRNRSTLHLINVTLELGRNWRFE